MNRTILSQSDLELIFFKYCNLQDKANFNYSKECIIISVLFSENETS